MPCSCRFNINNIAQSPPDGLAAHLHHRLCDLLLLFRFSLLYREMSDGRHEELTQTKSQTTAGLARTTRALSEQM